MSEEITAAAHQIAADRLGAACEEWEASCADLPRRQDEITEQLRRMVAGVPVGCINLRPAHAIEHGEAGNPTADQWRTYALVEVRPGAEMLDPTGGDGMCGEPHGSWSCTRPAGHDRHNDGHGTTWTYDAEQWATLVAERDSLRAEVAGWHRPTAYLPPGSPHRETCRSCDEFWPCTTALRSVAGDAPRGPLYAPRESETDPVVVAVTPESGRGPEGGWDDGRARGHAVPYGLDTRSE